MNPTKLSNSFYFSAILLLLPTAWSYKIFHLTDHCVNGHLDINMASLGSNSSGILKLSKDGKFKENMHCEITLNPPLAYGVVASVRLINLPSTWSSSRYCNNSSIKIHTSSSESNELCGYSKDESEFMSFDTWEPMKITFHSENVSNNTQVQFQITFTAARQTKSWCSKEEFMCSNQRCIWRGHTCDGHNNCGDLSDESSIAHCSVLPEKMTLSTKESIGIIIGTVAFCIVLVTVVAYLRRQRSNRLRSFAERRATVTEDILRLPRNSLSHLLPSRPPPKYEDIQRSDYFSTAVCNNTVAIHVENLQSSSINQ